MVDDTVRAIHDAPSSLADFQTQIDVLKSIFETFIEPTGLLEHVAPHQHARSGDALKFASAIDHGRVSRELPIDMIGCKHDPGEGHARMLNGAVFVQQLAADYRDIGV